MDKLATINDEMRTIVKAQQEAFDAYGDDFPTDVEGEVKARNRRLAELREQRTAAFALDDARKAAEAEHEYQTKPANGLVLPGSASPGDRPAALLAGPKTAGQIFTEDARFKAWFEHVAPHGLLTQHTKVDSPAVEIPGGLKALITGASDTSGGAFVQNDVQSGLVPFGRRPLTIRNIVINGRTSSDTVEFVRATSETNAAAPVAEATATAGASGTKPESALAFEKVTVPVKTIAHWIPATTRALADAPQMRTLIDEFLRYGLEEELEDQMVTGDGIGENFTGIANISGTQSQAWDTDILTTTRKAKTKVRTIGRAMASAFLLHPNDWQTIDLLQDNEARYYYGGPSQEGNPRLWGLPVVESEAVPEGTGYVGAWRYCVLWDREQASIQVSNSHSDFFIRNLVAILAELRAAFTCLKPNTIVEIDLTA